MQKFLASLLNISFVCILWDFRETPESLLTILDDSKVYTIIPFVPHTVVFAVKLLRHNWVMIIKWGIMNYENVTKRHVGGDDKLWINLAWPNDVMN